MGSTQSIHAENKISQIDPTAGLGHIATAMERAHLADGILDTTSDMFDVKRAMETALHTAMEGAHTGKMYLDRLREFSSLGESIPKKDLSGLHRYVSDMQRQLERCGEARSKVESYYKDAGKKCSMAQELCSKAIAVRRRDKILCGSIGAVGLLGAMGGVVGGVVNLGVYKVFNATFVVKIPRLFVSVRVVGGIALMVAGLYEARVYSFTQKELSKGAEEFHSVVKRVDSMRPVIYKSHFEKERARQVLEDLKNKTSGGGKCTQVEDCLQDLTSLENICLSIGSASTELLKEYY